MKTSLLSLTALISAFAVQAAEGDMFIVDNLKYTVTSETNNEVKVEANDKASLSGELIIPSIVEHDGTQFNVTAVGDKAFYECSGVTSIVIPESVTSLGQYAFYGCSGATSLSIPESLTTISFSAFGICSSLTSVTIPETVTSIGDFAFARCANLTSVRIPDAVTYIGTMAFRECTSLTTVYLPQSLADIGYSVFEQSTAIKQIYYPAEIPQPLYTLWIFNTDIYQNATLYVPATAVELCKDTRPWNRFNTIQAYDLDGIDNVAADFDPALPYEIYTPGGVSAGTTTDGLQPGIYILRQGTAVRKIAVN